MRTGRFARPHELATASVVGKPDQKSQKRSSQSHGIYTGQAAQLSNPEGAGGELAGDASLPSASRICSPSFGNFMQTGTNFSRGN